MSIESLSVSLFKRIISFLSINDSICLLSTNKIIRNKFFRGAFIPGIRFGYRSGFESEAYNTWLNNVTSLFTNFDKIDYSVEELTLNRNIKDIDFNLLKCQNLIVVHNHILKFARNESSYDLISVEYKDHFTNIIQGFSLEKMEKLKMLNNSIQNFESFNSLTRLILDYKYRETVELTLPEYLEYLTVNNSITSVIANPHLKHIEIYSFKRLDIRKCSNLTFFKCTGILESEFLGRISDSVRCIALCPNILNRINGTSFSRFDLYLRQNETEIVDLSKFTIETLRITGNKNNLNNIILGNVKYLYNKVCTNIIFNNNLLYYSGIPTTEHFPDCKWINMKCKEDIPKRFNITSINIQFGSKFYKLSSFVNLSKIQITIPKNSKSNLWHLFLPKTVEILHLVGKINCRILADETNLIDFKIISEKFNREIKLPNTCRRIHIESKAFCQLLNFIPVNTEYLTLISDIFNTDIILPKNLIELNLVINNIDYCLLIDFNLEKLTRLKLRMDNLEKLNIGESVRYLDVSLCKNLKEIVNIPVNLREIVKNSKLALQPRPFLRIKTV